MEQLTKNQAVATSQEAVQNQNEPQLRDENAHNDKSVHGVLNPTYQAGLRRDAVQPDIERSEERRVGKECRSRWSRADHKKKTRAIGQCNECAGMIQRTQHVHMRLVRTRYRTPHRLRV